MSSRAAELRTYSSKESVVFRIAASKFGGLSNMSSGFPLYINGAQVWSSEALYQACKYPLSPEIQRLIIAEKSPMTAKMKAKHYLVESRADWERIRIRVMRWCLRVKLAQNWNRFGALLLSTRQRPIVEESTRDEFWAAKPTKPGELVGVNALGRLLMELREELNGPERERLRIVRPPKLRDFCFLGVPVQVIKSVDWSAPSEQSAQGNIEQSWHFQV